MTKEEKYEWLAEVVNTQARFLIAILEKFLEKILSRKSGWNIERDLDPIKYLYEKTRIGEIIENYVERNQGEDPVKLIEEEVKKLFDEIIKRVRSIKSWRDLD